jgi:chromate transport protein ChrA
MKWVTVISAALVSSAFLQAPSFSAFVLQVAGLIGGALISFLNRNSIRDPFRQAKTDFWSARWSVHDHFHFCALLAWSAL